MNIRYMNMIGVSPAALIQNGNGVFENGYSSEGNEGVITDVWTDYGG